LPVDFSNIAIPFLQKQQIWDIAEKVRKKYWGDELPVDIEIIAERGYNIYLTPVPGLKSVANTEAFLSSNLDEIMFDLKSPDVRLRFSIAHELGHKELHSNQIMALRRNSYDEWREMLDNIPAEIWGRAEWQAREFAGRLLVPRLRLIKIIKENKQLIDQAKNKVPDLEISALNEYLSRHLSSQFDVSDDVIIARLLAEALDPFSIVS